MIRTVLITAIITCSLTVNVVGYGMWRYNLINNAEQQGQVEEVNQALNSWKKLP